MYEVLQGWTVNGLELMKPRRVKFNTLEEASEYYDRVDLAKDYAESAGCRLYKFSMYEERVYKEIDELIEKDSGAIVHVGIRFDDYGWEEYAREVYV